MVWLTTLEQRLSEAVRYQPQVEIVKEPVEAALTAVCEGRASSTRTEFGVDFSVTPYFQHAIATRLRCEISQGGIARANVFTKIWLALFGQFDWRAAP